MRNVLILLVFLVCCFPVTAVAQDVSWGSMGDQPAVVVASEENTTVTNTEPQRRMGDLTRRDRRRLGLTIRNVLRVTRELKKEGELVDVSRSEVSIMVLDRIMEENPKEYSAVAASIDWDALLDFIERLIPLIMRLIELFGGLGDVTVAPAFQHVHVSSPTTLAA